MVTSSPVSSATSRRAACSSVSPGSTRPPGIDHRPFDGAWPRRITRMRPSGRLDDRSCAQHLGLPAHGGNASAVRARLTARPLPATVGAWRPDHGRRPVRGGDRRRDQHAHGADVGALAGAVRLDVRRTGLCRGWQPIDGGSTVSSWIGPDPFGDPVEVLLRLRGARRGDGRALRRAGDQLPARRGRRGSAACEVRRLRPPGAVVVGGGRGRSGRVSPARRPAGGSGWSCTRPRRARSSYSR